ncbi:hypothetical protein ACLQ2N_26195 [Streptomyces sp. DT224]|uniref:hypothetical protein n=1 Tax=Streptomyces sp. DT224 TaxID=3393426 RepID=UPI003CF7B169
MHDGPESAVVGVPCGHQLLRPDEGVVDAEAEQLLRTQMACGEHQVAVPEVGRVPGTAHGAAVMVRQERLSYSADG